MVTISKKAADECRTNNRVIGLLMDLYDTHWTTIVRWCEKRDARLISPSAIEIIKKRTTLKDDEILEREVEKA